MNIPTREQCLAFMDEFEVPENVRKHVFLVTEVAVFLGNKVKSAGEDVNLELLEAAALLHDLDKIKTLKTDNHCDVTKDFLYDKGFSEVADIICKHLIPQIVEPGLHSWEEKLVTYSDKRSRGDTLINLKDRFDDLRERYPEYVNPMWEEAEQLFFDLEKEIFTKVGIKPEELKDFVGKK